MCPSNPNCATHGAAAASASNPALGSDFGTDSMLADAGINTVAKVVSDFTGLPQVPMGGLTAGQKEVHTDASGKLVCKTFRPSRKRTRLLLCEQAAKTCTQLGLQAWRPLLPLTGYIALMRRSSVPSELSPTLSPTLAAPSCTSSSERFDAFFRALHLLTQRGHLGYHRAITGQRVKADYSHRADTDRKLWKGAGSPLSIDISNCLSWFTGHTVQADSIKPASGFKKWLGNDASLGTLLAPVA